mgnify:FL=1
MPLIRQPVTNLIGGVSQQAPAIRALDKCEEELNTWASQIDGCIKRPHTTHIKRLLAATSSNWKYHFIYRQLDQQYTAIFRDTASGGGLPKIYTNIAEGSKAAGDELTILDPQTTGFGYINTSTNPKADLKVVTVADYTFVLNKTKVAGMDTGTLTPAVVTATEAYIFVRQGNYKTNYKIRIKMGVSDQTVTTSTWNGQSAVGGELNSIKTDDIAADLKTRLDTAWNGTAGYVVPPVAPNFVGTTRTGSVLRIRFNNPATAIEPVDSIGDTILSVVWKQVPRVAGSLPDICTHGFIIKVVGDEEISGDDYYVKFVADEGTGSFGRGYWQEDLTYAQEYLYFVSTMPHALVRKYDTAGTVPGVLYVGPYFEWIPVPWDNKLVGDTVLNARPSFINKLIQNLFFYKQRLGVLAEDRVVLSEVSEPFNFWRTTLLTLLDSDRIDVLNNNNPIALCKAAIGYNENVIMKSARGQFLLRGGDILSPRTVQITPVANFESYENLDPIQSGRSLFFGFKRGDYSGIREFFQVGDSLTFDSADVTLEIPNYILGEIEWMAVSTLEDTLVIKGSTSNTLYVYRYIWAGDQKILSSWRTWTFDNGASIRHFGFVENILYLVMEYSDGIYLEKMNVATGFVDSGSTFINSLDRRIDQSQISALSYNAGLNRSTFTFPYTIPASINALYLPVVIEKITGTVFDYVSHTTTTLTVTGDLTGKNFWTGHSYPQTYKPTKPITKTVVGRGVGPESAGIQVVKHMILEYKNSGPFVIYVNVNGRAQVIYQINKTNLTNGTIIVDSSVLKTDRCRIPIHARPEEVTVEISNFNPTPTNLSNIIWTLMEYTGASRIL